MARRLDPRPAPDLRYAASNRRVRARLGDLDVADSKDALFVWEPGRPVPAYEDPDLADHVVVDWAAMDAWFEENEEVLVHPRDPFHRVDVRASARHVRIELDGSLIAESERPLMLFETGLPARFYLPKEDVRAELIGPTETRTRCPYKGEAVHWSVRVDGQTHEDIAWTYPDPIRDVDPIRDLVAFYDERVDVTIDGERQERPETPWSRPG